ncbi:MAG: DUF5717 family protein [Defluviitaleaceae bacterium]|nr:DUF5717 family protein [Defluviitaleaceae bacterium]
MNSEIIEIFRYYFFYVCSKNNYISHTYTNDEDKNNKKKENKYLEKSYQKTEELLKKYPYNIFLYLYKIFFKIEMKKTQEALEMLEILKVSISHYKNNSEVYTFYLYLKCILDKDSLKNTEIIFRDYQNKYLYFISYLYLKKENRVEYSYIYKSFEAGNRSFFLYLCVYEILKTGIKYYEKNMLINFLKWANAHNILTNEILEINKEIISSIVYKDINLFAKIYEKNKCNFLLDEIIVEVMKKNEDISILSHSFYAEIIKTKFCKETNKLLMYSSYKNNILEIPKMYVQEYIKNGIDDDIAHFVFYFIIDFDDIDYSEEIIDLYNLYENILKTVVRGIQNRTNEKDIIYYLKIFKYVIYKNIYFENIATTLEYLSVKQVENTIKKISKILLDWLFVYNFSFETKNTKYIWIKNQIKSSLDTYEIEDKSVNIKVPNMENDIIFFDDKHKILNENVKITKYTKNGFFLENYLYKNNYISEELLLYLSNYYFRNEILEDTYFLISLLERTIKIKNICENFKSDLTWLLIKVLSENNKKENAFDYLKKMNLKKIDDKYSMAVIEIFMHKMEYNMAIDFINIKMQILTDDILINCIKTFMDEYKKPHPKIYKTETDKKIVNITYRVLVNGFYNDDFLDIVLQNYNGSLLELCKLSNVLNDNGIINVELDEKILNTSIFTRDIIPEVENVFLRFFASRPEKCKNFIYYICYHILKEKKTITTDTLYVLENFIGEHPKDLILYTAISVILINEETVLKDKVLNITMKYLEENDVFLPVLKKLDKKYLSYAQQNVFCIEYEYIANKKVYLNVKFENYDYKKIEMKYFRFGIYFLNLNIFYGEKITYYFEHENISEKIIHEYKNEKILISENPKNEFEYLNNSIIYNHLLEYDILEKNFNEFHKKNKINTDGEDYKML